MKISELTKELKVIEKTGGNDPEIADIAYDSRKCRPASLFVCIKGALTDGHKYIGSALENGARVIITQEATDMSLYREYDPLVIRVENTRDALALLSERFFQNPSGQLSITGVTGTKGKTTTTYMIKHIFDLSGQRTALSGTIQNIIDDEISESVRTTPESYEFKKFLAHARDKKIDQVIMEVSSQGLKLDRVKYTHFKTAIFTNLYKDHIAPGEHSDIEDYFIAKAKLFSMCDNAIVNIDNEYSNRIIENASCNKIYTFSINKKADFKAENIVKHSHSIEFDLRSDFFSGRITSGIPGMFSVYNSLAAAGNALIAGIRPEYILEGLKTITVPGRAETFKSEKGYTVIVDYAHTRDSLENILYTVKDFTKGKLISVFGCGGNRDRNRRFDMGEVSGRIADFTIITSDNPRKENPLDIMEDIRTGIIPTSGEYIMIEDRKEAIKYALQIALENDVIVIAGKGHETYQEFSDRTIHFDDREIVREILPGI